MNAIRLTASVSRIFSVNFQMDAGGVRRADVLRRCPEPAHPCSLTQGYDQGVTGYGDLTVRIFRVAEFLADGSYALAGDFAGYPVKIHGITAQQEWQAAAAVLASYAEADAMHRPDGVTVEILCDGEYHTTVTLNAGNNWTYAWETIRVDSRRRQGTERSRYSGSLPPLFFLVDIQEIVDHRYDLASGLPGDAVSAGPEVQDQLFGVLVPHALGIHQQIHSHPQHSGR